MNPKFYIYTKTYGYVVYDMQYDEDLGYGGSNTYKEYTNTVIPSAGVTNKEWFGHTNAPPASWNWVDEPTNSDWVSKGYYISGILALKKWDALTNGIVWK